MQNNQIQSNTMQYHAVQSNTITLPEAERTQGIESVLQLNLNHLFQLR